MQGWELDKREIMRCEHSVISTKDDLPAAQLRTHYCTLCLTLVCSLVWFLPGVPCGGGGRILSFILLRVTQELTEGHHGGSRSLVILIKLTAGHLGVCRLPHPFQLVLPEEEEVRGLVMLRQEPALQSRGVVRLSLRQNVELRLWLRLQQVRLACKLSTANTLTITSVIIIISKSFSSLTSFYLFSFNAAPSLQQFHHFCIGLFGEKTVALKYLIILIKKEDICYKVR